MAAALEERGIATIGGHIGAISRSCVGFCRAAVGAEAGFRRRPFVVHWSRSAQFSTRAPNLLPRIADTNCEGPSVHDTWRVRDGDRRSRSHEFIVPPRDVAVDDAAFARGRGVV